MAEYEVSVVAGEGDEDEEEVTKSPEEEVYAFIENYRSSEITSLNLAASSLIQLQMNMLKTTENVEMEPFLHIEEYLKKVNTLKKKVQKIESRKEQIMTRLKEAMAHLKKN